MEMEKKAVARQKRQLEQRLKDQIKEYFSAHNGGLPIRVLVSPVDYKELFGVKARNPQTLVSEIGLLGVSPNIYVQSGLPVLVDGDEELAKYWKPLETG